MVDWHTLSSMDFFKFASIYIVARAAFFYSLFSILYQKFNATLGVAKDLPSKKQLKNEIISNIKANLFEIILLTIVGISGIIKFHEFSWERLIITFTFCYFFFEVWFYCTHRLLHTRYFLWAHKTHHVSVVTTPFSALSLSITEKAMNDVGMIIVPCLLTHFFPFILEGILAYHLYNFYINVLGHSNIEILPKNFAKSFFGKAFTTTTYHSLHHLRGKTNYGLFLTFLDRLFNTRDKSYEVHYENVISSRGIVRKDLNESKSH